MKVFLRGYIYIPDEYDLPTNREPVCVWEKKQIDREDAIKNAYFLKETMGFQIVAIESDV